MTKCWIVSRIDDNGEIQSVHSTARSADNTVGCQFVENLSYLSEEQTKRVQKLFNTGQIRLAIEWFNDYAKECQIRLEEHELFSDSPVPIFPD